MNKIKNAFTAVRADEKLKKNTVAFLQNERAKREGHFGFRYAYRYAAALAAVFVILFGVGSYSVLNTSVSYISIDVNPSVELSLNRFDTVVEATAYNDDGTVVLENVDLKGKSYTKAIDTLLSDQEFLSYMQDSSKIDFTVVSDNEDRIRSGIQGCEGYRQYNGSCHGADNEIMEQAHCHGLSFGKYRAYLELSEYDSSVTAEDCKGMTMRQIHDLIEEHTSDCHSDNSETAPAQKHQHGHHDH